MDAARRVVGTIQSTTRLRKGPFRIAGADQPRLKSAGKTTPCRVQVEAVRASTCINQGSVADMLERTVCPLCTEDREQIERIHISFDNLMSPGSRQIIQRKRMRQVLVDTGNLKRAGKDAARISG